MASKGDVFRITESFRHRGWWNALVQATEIHSWGIDGFVSVPYASDTSRKLWTRLMWDEVEFVGQVKEEDDGV